MQTFRGLLRSEKLLSVWVETDEKNNKVTQWLSLFLFHTA